MNVSLKQSGPSLREEVVKATRTGVGLVSQKLKVLRLSEHVDLKWDEDHLRLKVLLGNCARPYLRENSKYEKIGDKLS